MVLGGGIWLTFAPTPSSAANGFRFSTAGDYGAWSGFRDSLDFLNASGSDFAIALGDLSYGGNTGYASTVEKAWCLKFQKFFENVVILAGNHDTGAFPPGEGNINNYTKSCPFPLSTRLVSNPGEYGKQYYFDYPLRNPIARFILISPDLVFVVDGGEHYDYDKGTPRYEWTKSAIEGARADHIPWVIAGMHKNCIGAGEHGCETGADILNLFLEEKVDLILNAHEHNYERSHQLGLTDGCQAIVLHRFNPDCIVDRGDDGKYQRGAGSVLVIAGTGGREIDDFNLSDPYAGYFAAHMGAADLPATGGGNGIVTFDVASDQIVMRTSFNASYTDTFTIKNFQEGFLPRFVQNLPIVAPIVVGSAGFGVGALLALRAKRVSVRTRDFIP